MWTHQSTYISVFLCVIFFPAPWWLGAVVCLWDVSLERVLIIFLIDLRILSSQGCQETGESARYNSPKLKATYSFSYPHLFYSNSQNIQFTTIQNKETCSKSSHREAETRECFWQFCSRNDRNNKMIIRPVAVCRLGKLSQPLWFYFHLNVRKCCCCFFVLF